MKGGSLVYLTLALVVGVVLALGTLVVWWLTREDLERARADARAQQAAAEHELRALARLLVDEADASARGLVAGADRRIRQWIEDEPLAIYRDAESHALDIDELRQGLRAEVRRRSLAGRDHVDIVSRKMDEEAEAQIERVAITLRAEAAAQAEAATAARRARLTIRLALLLLAMSVLLAVTLYLLVIAPVDRLRRAVGRIAAGDLQTPVSKERWRTRELAALAHEVDRMREQIRGATEGLEDEVARQTERLEKTLAERTTALEELETAQDQLIQAEKMAGLGTLAGGVAHEFNNLLGGILGCLESAKAGTDDPSVLDDLDMAKRTAGRATELVQALLGVTRPARGRFERVALLGVVDDVLRAAEVTARHRRVELVREIEDEPVVSGDEGQLHQVALNLVTNALQAVDDGERVTVRLGRDGRHAVLEVLDEGPGVAPEDRSRVFEPFFTRRAEGTGLGLFVSYGIVERHGGRIEALDGPQGGARFRVRLPLAGSEPA